MTAFSAANGDVRFPCCCVGTDVAGAAVAVAAATAVGFFLSRFSRFFFLPQGRKASSVRTPQPGVCSGLRDSPTPTRSARATPRK